jgi:hypothetical protein
MTKSSDCSFIKNKFLSDENFKLPKNKIIHEKTSIELLSAFCSLNEENDVVLDYRYFKLFKQIKTPIENEIIIQHIVDTINTVLEKKKIFTVQLCLKSLTISDIDKYYKFISDISETLKLKFPDKLNICFVYNAPFIFSQFFSIIKSFIDKETMNKIKLVD